MAPYKKHEIRLRGVCFGTNEQQEQCTFYSHLLKRPIPVSHAFANMEDLIAHRQDILDSVLAVCVSLHMQEPIPVRDREYPEDRLPEDCYCSENAELRIVLLEESESQTVYAAHVRDKTGVWRSVELKDKCVRGFLKKTRADRRKFFASVISVMNQIPPSAAPPAH